jgi:hypothetical protein
LCQRALTTSSTNRPCTKADVQHLDLLPITGLAGEKATPSSTDTFRTSSSLESLTMPATGTEWRWSARVCAHRAQRLRPESRLSRLQLGDITNDGKCDVAIRPAHANIAPRWYSRSGTSGWIQLQQVVRAGR